MLSCSRQVGVKYVCMFASRVEMRRNYRRGKEGRGWSSHKRSHHPHGHRRPSHSNRAESLEQEEPQTTVNAGPSSSEDPSSSSSMQNSVAPEMPL